MKFINTLSNVILFLVLLIASSCENKKPTADKDINKNEYTFIDTTNVSVTYLYQGKYILKVELVVDSIGNELQSMASTTIGKYEIVNDTLNINFPDLKSQEYKYMKTKYFWVDSSDYGGYTTKFLIPPERIIDSVLGKKFDNYGGIECIYGEQKAIIRNGKLIYLDSDLKEREE